MYTKWNPQCRSCNAYVDTKEHQTSVHSPPDVKEHHFGFKVMSQPITTDLQRWLDVETYLDELAFSKESEVKTRICIHCAKEISLRFQEQTKQNEEEFKALSAVRITQEQQQQQQQEEEQQDMLTKAKAALNVAKMDWLRSRRLVIDLQQFSRSLTKQMSFAERTSA